ncbi:patatin-like phospholipase family protein [Streptomyces sp. SRF1]|uniref:patatin-like phospholipase family protein n=1 Tax=Streptomyces sp. SRF1 TaxID=1549642 RepID=UPI0025B07AB4|nr:patatin-like phospholipase family protein [Streptomyces sp. SRF1]MDN3060037.1 patatin-like phospholipase family protein [Streptomyces sp. SRF1]
MTESPENLTRALVLGGGGAFGIAWQSGFLTGLRDQGIALSAADVILGTSAGSLVGALLAADRDLTDAFASLSALGQSVDADSLAAGSQALMEAMQQAGLDTDPRMALTAIGRMAREARTLDEETFLGLFAVLADTPWPANFRCTAIDTDSGELTVWGPDSGVPLQHAVAASCAVPAIFPTVTAHGRHYMDGGILSHLNAAAAPATDVLIALSCFPLAGRGAPVKGGMAATAAVVDAELDRLSRTRRVLAIAPDPAADPNETNMMDIGAAQQATQAGALQAAREHQRIKDTWNR